VQGVPACMPPKLKVYGRPTADLLRSILAVRCPRVPIPFVGRVSAGTSRTNEREKS
jgi:hypothetical protein